MDPRWWDRHGVERHECPAREAGIEVFRLIQAHEHYRAGHLPAPGGMGDQANTFCEAVAYLSAALASEAAKGANRGG